MKEQRFAILGDVHGNLEALTAVLEDAKTMGCTGFVSVGDIVGYNANPSECLEIVRDISSATVRGNHDHYCSHDESLDDFHPLAANVVDWTRHQLTDDETAFLRKLPMVKMISGFTLVHSTLDMPEKWGYVFDGLEADAHFNYQTTSVCFYGHTHVPVCFEKEGRVRRSAYTDIKIVMGRKYFINVGSSGTRWRSPRPRRPPGRGSSARTPSA